MRPLLSTVRPWLLLSSLLISQACDSEPQGHGPEVFPEVEAGDGSRAYHKVAQAMCQRMFTCASEHELTRAWTSTATCTDDLVTKLTLYGRSTFDTRLSEVDCRPESDFKAVPAELASCLDALENEACDSAFAGGPLLAHVRRVGPSACRELASHLAQAEDERAHAVPLGAPCGPGDQCVTDAYCAAADGASCGECRKQPTEGEACLPNANGTTPVWCALGHVCSDGICRAQLPAEGERCGTNLDECADGLDCDADKKCRVLFHAGQPCKADQRAPCGAWLACIDGKCQETVADPTLRIGSACSLEGPYCVSGSCPNGKCAELADLGDPCLGTNMCKTPLVCVDDRCEEPPACASGKTGEWCSDSQQCAPDQYCGHTNLMTTDQCAPIVGLPGTPCDEGECYTGQCKAGTCTVAAAGAACKSASECESLACGPDGTCEPLCR